jgi:hypothetical protein
MTDDENTVINQNFVILVEVRDVASGFEVTAIVNVANMPQSFVIKSFEDEEAALDFLKLFHTQSNLFEAHGLEGTMINLDDLDLPEDEQEENPIWQELLKELPDIDN